jgi:hypothetical protein
VAVRTVDEFRGAVDAAFAVIGPGLAPWRNPHAGRAPSEDDYSRVTDPMKWRILGARALAWVVAAVDAGMATLETDIDARWSQPPGPDISRADRLVPARTGGLALTIAHSAIDDVDAVGVTIGVGDPAVCIGWLPDCGCDACDRGSDGELEQLDRYLGGVVFGTFRLLTQRDRRILVIDGEGWSASGYFRRGEVERILGDPKGWDELRGPAW